MTSDYFIDEIKEFEMSLNITFIDSKFAYGSEENILNEYMVSID